MMVNKEEASRTGLEPGEKKQILKSVEGCAYSGETLFIMGASGAGKTTLLNALCDRLETGSRSELTG